MPISSAAVSSTIRTPVASQSAVPSDSACSVGIRRAEMLPDTILGLLGMPKQYLDQFAYAIFGDGCCDLLPVLCAFRHRFGEVNGLLGLHFSGHRRFILIDYGFNQRRPGHRECAFDDVAGLRGL